jgi:hypothetical protein
MVDRRVGLLRVEGVRWSGCGGVVDRHPLGQAGAGDGDEGRVHPRAVEVGASDPETCPVGVSVSWFDQ